MDQKDKTRLAYAMFLAELTNREFLIISLWMEGFNQSEIIEISGVTISQPAMCKKIKGIQKRIGACYKVLKNSAL